MTPVATPDLVTTLLGQEPESLALVDVLLREAHRRLARRIPALDERVGHDDGFADSVAFVEANAAARVLRSPDGYRSETAGGISYTLDTRVAAGFLTILAEEWVTLGVATRPPGTIRPTVQVPPTWPLGWDPTWP